MRKTNKIKILFFICFSLLSVSNFAVDIKMSKATKNSFVINGSSNENIQYANCSVSLIKAIKTSTEKGTFVRLESEGMVNNGIDGQPELPSYSELIEIPQKATVKVSVISYDEETIALSSKSISQKVMPYQEPCSRSEQKAFAYNQSTYARNAFVNTQKVSFEVRGTMRDTRFGRLVVNPIQYNPSTNTIKVLNNMKIKIEFVNADYSATSALKESAGTVYMKALTSTFIASNESETSAKATTSYTKETMLIVANSMFKSNLTTFIAHKKKMGLNVIEHYVSTGTSNEEIQKYIKNVYNNPPSGYKKPLYLLLVGDIDQIPSWGPYDHGGRKYYTDLEYATMDGDNIPDLFYGRFSANNSSELMPQINKTIEYESYSMPDASYLYNSVLVAGWDSYGSTITEEGNSQMIYASKEYCNSKNHIQAHVMLQDEPNAITYTQQIINKTNVGCGLLNYSGHGEPEGFHGQFYIKDIPQLNNAHKYGLWIANCCLTNKFDTYECFGEALLRAESKGVVGYIGASCVTYPSPDYYWAVGYRPTITSHSPSFDSENLGMYDKLFHTNGIPNKDKFTTQGSLIYAGNLSVEKHSTRRDYYWQIYHLMGDPSVNVRFTPPTECDEDMTITANINDGMVHDEFIANRSIVASNKISNYSNTHYGANYNIRLVKGFKVYKGSKFRANLYGCNEGNINAILRKGSFISNTYDSEETNSEEYDVLPNTNSGLTLYPNPTDGEFFISFAAEDVDFHITITDVTGKTVYTTSGTGRGQAINLEGKSSGVYFVHVNAGENTYIEKIILK